MGAEETTPRIDPAVRTAYLARLGLDAEPPSIDALQRLHSRHVERIPYETLWIHAGEPWSIDPSEAAHRIALEGRGGYCYHLNGAFAALLDALGYEVHRHVGAVHGPDGPSERDWGNHLVLTIHGLPTDEHPVGVWYTDVGLGDALHCALPLAPGEHEHAPYRLTLTELDGGRWQLAHDPRGGFTGMMWKPDEARWADFAAPHEWLSSDPDSGFVRIGMAERRDASGIDVVRGLNVMRIEQSGTSSHEVTDRDDWFTALGNVGVTFDAAPPQLLDRLWDRTLANHRAWQEEQEEKKPHPQN